MQFLIALAWISMPLDVTHGDGRYDSKHSCEAFVEFIGTPNIVDKHEDGTYLILDGGNGDLFTAKCIPATH